MPKMTFSDENKAKSLYDYDKLNLEKGERARITTIEGEPEFEWVHSLRAPQIVNGKPVMETESFKTKSGATEQREVMKTDFIGQHICIGDLNILADKRADVDNCPVCAKSKESDAVEAPKRRFAMHVVRYKTQPGSFVIQDPFMAEIAVWAFTDTRFNQLIELTKDWGNLQVKDLNLGPCESKQYQKYDMNVAAECEWLKSDDRKQQIKLVYNNNKLEDLSVAIARRQSREQVEEDLDRVLTRYQIATGRRTEADATVIDLAPAVDVASLIGEPTQPTQASPVTEPSPVQDVVETPAVSGLDEFTPAQDEAPKKDDKLMSLEDILNL